MGLRRSRRTNPVSAGKRIGSVVPVGCGQFRREQAPDIVQFFQNDLVKRASMVKISRRPISISAIIINFAPAVKPL